MTFKILYARCCWARRSRRMPIHVHTVLPVQTTLLSDDFESAVASRSTAISRS
jgi:hypothetical protein